MQDKEPIWLVRNRASGSNDEAALARLENALLASGFSVSRRICFPEESLPDRAALESAGIRTLCVFAGDGTIHAVVVALFGWEGRILVLPGGTMNMLSHRLHGDADAVMIIERLHKVGGKCVRPPILQSDHGPALTGALAGPGTAWNDVREALRHSDIADLASSTIAAASRSISGERVVCRGLEDVRPEGYAAIAISPCVGGVELKGFYADMAGDYVGQLFAILQRDFRNGPHDDLGTFTDIEIVSLSGGRVDLLLDGEPQEGNACERFTQMDCQVDLLASAYEE